VTIHIDLFQASYIVKLATKAGLLSRFKEIVSQANIEVVQPTAVHNQCIMSDHVPTIEVRLRVRVCDEQSLWDYARKRYAACHGGGGDFDEVVTTTEERPSWRLCFGRQGKQRPTSLVSRSKTPWPPVS